MSQIDLGTKPHPPVIFYFNYTYSHFPEQTRGNPDLAQRFSNFTGHTNHLRRFLKDRLWLSWFLVEPETLHFNNLTLMVRGSLFEKQRVLMSHTACLHLTHFSGSPGVMGMRWASACQGQVQISLYSWSRGLFVHVTLPFWTSILMYKITHFSESGWEGQRRERMNQVTRISTKLSLRYRWGNRFREVKQLTKDTQPGSSKSDSR